VKCTARDCEQDANVGIRTINNRDRDGLVHTIYTSLWDAPKTAVPYCVEHGTDLAANLTCLGYGVARVSIE
jgi:hypothetical protein